MWVDIFKPMRMGKEVFHAQSFDHNSFVMNWSMDAGGKVPSHIHEHMDEHFLITSGEVKFKVAGKTFVKRKGEELLVPKGTVHSITNASKEQLAITVTYSPCADTHKMFEIIATLNESNPGSIKNLLKYLYVGPRLKLKSFSTPYPPVANSIINSIITVAGKIGRWDKHLKDFQQ